MYAKSSNYTNAFMVLMSRPDAVSIIPKKNDFTMKINSKVLRPYILNAGCKKK